MPQALISLKKSLVNFFSSLNADLNPICHLLVLLGVSSILHISRIRVKQCLNILPNCTQTSSPFLPHLSTRKKGHIL
jgi:hypothetical protein